MTGVRQPHSISIRVFSFLRRYMDTQGLSYAFDKDIDPKGKTAYDIAVELHIPPEEIEAIFLNGSVKNIYDYVSPGDRVAFLPYGTPRPYRVFLGMVRENVKRARREKSMANIQELIRSKSKKAGDEAGCEVLVLEDAHALKIAKECGCKVYDVYVNALKEGICPYRYIRNRETISLKEQLMLAESRVAVIGAGGLGGQVILLLARIGIGHLVVVDKDIFEETNLNRQALCNKNSLGKSKAKEALASVGAINPGIKVSAYPVELDYSNASEMLSDSDVIVDALDNISDRFVLEEICKKLGILLVHGALAGFEGQVMTIFPDDTGLKNLYGSKRVNENSSKSPEAVFGIPAMTPCIIATLQAMEVLKIILKRGKIFKNAMLYVDLETGRMSEYVFEKHKY